MRRATPTLLTALALVIALAAPASAGAAEPTGNTTLTVAPAVAGALGERGVAISGGRGADTAGRQTRFQIGGGAIAAGSAELSLDGALRFTAGQGKARRVVRLTGLRVRLGPDSTLSAKPNGGKRRTVFDLESPSTGLAIDATKGTAQLHGARLVWRPAIAQAIDRWLGTRIPRGALGKARVSAATIAGAGSGAGSDTPHAGPLGDEPPLLARPPSAVDVTSASLTWNVRDSWIRYTNTETAPETLEGASAKAPIAESSHPCPDRPVSTNPTLVYSYDFPFSNGWYDPASGTAALYYVGGIRFSYLGHGIDLTARNPEIEINGAASQAIFRLRGAGETPYPDKRADLLALTVPAPPSEGPASSFSFPAPLRGALTSNGQAVFAGFYPPPNNGFGCLGVSFATG